MNIKRVVRLMGDISLENVGRVIDQIFLLHADAETEEIFLFICSSGGSTGVAYAFFDLITTMRVPLVTIGIGYVDSAALYVFLAGRKRLIASHATVLLHEVKRTYDQGATFSPEDLKACNTETALVIENQKSIIEASTGGGVSGERFEEMKRDVTVLTPEQAVKLGIAHGIWTQDITMSPVP